MSKGEELDRMLCHRMVDRLYGEALEDAREHLGDAVLDYSESTNKSQETLPSGVKLTPEDFKIDIGQSRVYWSDSMYVSVSYSWGNRVYRNGVLVNEIIDDMALYKLYHHYNCRTLLPSHYYQEIPWNYTWT